MLNNRSMAVCNLTSFPFRILPAKEMKKARIREKKRKSYKPRIFKSKDIR